MNFGFLLFNNLEELDLVEPWELVSIRNCAQRSHGPRIYQIKIRTCPITEGTGAHLLSPNV